jgi:D-ribose pyranase
MRGPVVLYSGLPAGRQRGSRTMAGPDRPGGVFFTKGGSPRMIIQGILNPSINSLLSRVRHTNSLVIADRGFPYWSMIETVDISLVDGIPTVLQVLDAIRPIFRIGQIYMAQEFLDQNPTEVHLRFAHSTDGIPVDYEPHMDFKKRIPQAIGLIRTADTVQYANMILISA